MTTEKQTNLMLDRKLENEGNSSTLPLKKRFSTITPEVAKASEIAEMSEPRNRRILPGVIRHGSCPHHTLAYYYDYSIQQINM